MERAPSIEVLIINTVAKVGHISYWRSHSPIIQLQPSLNLILEDAEWYMLF